MPAAFPDPAWLRDHRQAADYARYHLPGGDPDPAEFGAIWANMRRGERIGELRVLPPLVDAFADWAAEHGLLSSTTRV